MCQPGGFTVRLLDGTSQLGAIALRRAWSVATEDKQMTSYNSDVLLIGTEPPKKVELDPRNVCLCAHYVGTRMFKICKQNLLHMQYNFRQRLQQHTYFT